MPVVDALLHVFARAIFEKAKAFGQLDLTTGQRRRLIASLQEDVKACGAFIVPEVKPLEVSEAALREAKRLGITAKLCEQPWRNQKRFDKGRKLFHWEHVVPVSSIRKQCEAANSVDEVFQILNHRLRIAWILKSEDRNLTSLGYKVHRPDPDKAYQEAGITLIKFS